MKKFTIDIDSDFRETAKAIAKEYRDDPIIQYLKNSIVHTRDELMQMFQLGQMHARILEKYGFEIWEVKQ